MAQRGGKREGAGRKSKADELQIIEKMDKVAAPIQAFKNLWLKCQEGDVSALKLWLEYRIGKPTQQVDHTTNGESMGMPIATWSDIDRT